ncbi:hypothetical protein PH210_16905 [Paenibacillus sp. BSR1-1]|nr:hypothetical protein [Paenibacillus sp. BSR1-1]MDN3017876.1 hypothetical protein [Paenibacillus sp. BSR1-1]
MWARVLSIGLKGMEGYRVNVEVSTYIGTLIRLKFSGFPMLR